MAICEITFNFKLTNSNGEVENHSIKVDAELPESGPMLIDNVEKIMLESNKDAIRRAVATYLEELSKKKTGLERRDQRDVVQTNLTRYRVDSEIGRFEFTTHSVYRGENWPVYWYLSSECRHPTCHTRKQRHKPAAILCSAFLVPIQTAR